MLVYIIEDLLGDWYLNEWWQILKRYQVVIMCINPCIQRKGKFVSWLIYSSFFSLSVIIGGRKVKEENSEESACKVNTL